MPQRKPLAEGQLSANVKQWNRSGKGKPESPATSPVPSKSKRLRKRKPLDMIVPLKNGAGRMEIGLARFAQEKVRRLAINHGIELLTALHALVEGRDGEVSEEHRRILQEDELLTKAGEIHDSVKAVMIAGYRETPAGPVITEPLDLADPEHAAAAQKNDEELAAFGRRMEPWKRLLLAQLRGLEKKDQDRSR